jgi:predicted nucleotidyltransferase
MNAYIEGIPHFLTGSRRFGTFKDESDYDIAVCINQKQKILLSLIGKEVTSSSYNQGFKFKEDEKEYNIVPLHPRDYVSWYWAAKLMEALPNLRGMGRPEIHGLYETFIGLMKFAFRDQVIATNNYEAMCSDDFSFLIENNKGSQSFSFEDDDDGIPF